MNRLVELNVIAQVYSVERNSSIIEAKKQRKLSVHGLVYDLQTGRLNELQIPNDPFARIFDVTTN